MVAVPRNRQPSQFQRRHETVLWKCQFLRSLPNNQKWNRFQKTRKVRNAIRHLDTTRVHTMTVNILILLQTFRFNWYFHLAEPARPRRSRDWNEEERRRRKEKMRLDIEKENMKSLTSPTTTTTTTMSTPKTVAAFKQISPDDRIALNTLDGANASKSKRIRPKTRRYVIMAGELTLTKFRPIFLISLIDHHEHATPMRIQFHVKCEHRSWLVPNAPNQLRIHWIVLVQRNINN